jgi:threonine 3-dehydrogenase
MLARALPRALNRALPPARAASTAAAHKPSRRILVTGATGQIGAELVPLLRARLAGTRDALVLATDLRPAPGAADYAALDVTDAAALNALVAKHEVDTIVHLASLLSVTGEQQPALAMRVNRGGAENVLEIAAARGLRVFAPSTIAAFGPSTPRDATPDVTVMRPTTIYGVTKVYLELLGEYYTQKFGVDFRSVRYPGIISHRALPGGGTTDYAVNIFYDALRTGAYSCFLGAHSALPMMYMPDALAAAVGVLDAPAAALTQRTYNVTGCTFTPAELGAALSREMVAAGRAPLRLTYAPDFRQGIADSWPRSLNDDAARRDWGWRPEFDCASMTKDMFRELSKRIKME